MKVYTRVIEGHSALVYTYIAGGCCAFKFHTLAEVGAPYQGKAKTLRDRLAAACGCKVVTVELESPPYIVEALVKDGAAS